MRKQGIQFSIRLQPDLHEWLSEIAREHGLSMSDIVKIFLAQKRREAGNYFFTAHVSGEAVENGTPERG